MTDVQSTEEEARIQAIEANMRAAGVETHETVYDDYFGFDETVEYTLPDGKQSIIHKILTEGARRKYLKEIQRDITFRKQTGDATMRMASGEEKAALLRAAIVGWTLRDRNGQLLPFTPQKLNDFLERADPKIVDKIHKDIVKNNPWLLQDMSVEDIDREIADLTELREAKLKEEAGKDGS